MKLPHMVILILTTALMLSACGRSDKDVVLARIKHTGNGPDEFSIIPGKPLQAPESFNSLPTPTPGGANLSDQTPKADGIAALGGKPSAATSGGARAGEATLLNHALRYGTTPDIRQTLAAEDLETRRRHGKVNILRIGPNQDYLNAYKKQWLDSQSELQRLRRRGVLTPTAPPPS